MYFVETLDFSGGFKSLSFAIEAVYMEALTRKFTPYIVLKVILIDPCASRVFRLLENYF